MRRILSARRLPARCLAVALLTAFSVAPALAAEARVPYVPTPQEVVDRMLEIGKVGSSDYLIDLGSGDGRIVITAAKKHGTRGFGVDLNPDRINESNENAKLAGVTDKVAFYQRNLFETDLSQATVITMYLLPRVNLELRPKLLALVPGTRLVSHDFDMGDWKPDAQASLEVKDKYGGAGGTSDIFYWVVPARIAGAWNWQTLVSGKPQSYEMRLEQKHQVVTGSVAIAGRSASLKEVALLGTEIRFAFTADINGAPVKHVFTGKINGDAINGTVALSGARVQAQLEWNARRRGARSAAAMPLHVAQSRAGVACH
jgi:hypothetical protein